MADEGAATSLPGGSPPNDDLLAVIAHSLLSSVAVIVGGTELLSARWSELADPQRSDLLDTMRGQARHVAEVLDNLVRLGSPELIQVLDHLHEDDGEGGQPPAATG